MHAKRTIALLSLCFLASVLAFLLWNVTSANLLYHLPRRAVKLAALCMTGSAIALSTLMFQTVTANNTNGRPIRGIRRREKKGISYLDVIDTGFAGKDTFPE